MTRALVRKALVAAVALGALGIASSAGAQVYPPGGCSIGASVSVAEVGSQVTVTGTNFPAGPVNVLFDGQQVATGTASSDFSVTFTVPGVAPGPHTIVAAAANGSCTASTLLQVVDVAGGGGAPGPGAAGRAGGGGGGGALAFTGAEWVRFLVLLGLLLLTVGVALQRGARRRAEVQSQITR